MFGYTIDMGLSETPLRVPVICVLQYLDYNLQENKYFKNENGTY